MEIPLKAGFRGGGHGPFPLLIPSGWFQFYISPLPLVVAQSGVCGPQKLLEECGFCVHAAARRSAVENVEETCRWATTREQNCHFALLCEREAEERQGCGKWPPSRRPCPRLRVSSADSARVRSLSTCDGCERCCGEHSAARNTSVAGQWWSGEGLRRPPHVGPWSNTSTMVWITILDAVLNELMIWFSSHRGFEQRCLVTKPSQPNRC